MPLYFTMHPRNPQPRLINQTATAMLAGEVVIYPTDTSYALGCILTNLQGIEKMRRLREVNDKYPLTLLCYSIAQAAHYCLVDDRNYRILKQFTPGPYTFLLPATKKVPRQAHGVKHRLCGIRITNHPIPQALMQALGQPFLSTSCWPASLPAPLCVPSEFKNYTQGLVGMVLDGGEGKTDITSVVDLSGATIKVVRTGAGDVKAFLDME